MRPSRLRSERKKKTIQRFAFFLVLILVFGLLISVFSHSSYIAIYDVNVEGPKSQVSLVKGGIEEKLKGHDFRVFSKKNIFLFPINDTEKELQQKFPKILKLDIRRNGRNGLTAVVEERKISSLWCQASSTSQCLGVDWEGFIFEEASGFSTNAFFRYVTKDPKTIGQTIANEDEWQKIQEILKAFDTLESLASFTIAENHYELGFESERAKILLPKKASVQEMKDTFLLILEENTLKAATKGGKDFSKVLYIDIRFKDKAYYKLR